MKKILIGLFVLPLITGCAGALIEQTPMRMTDGSRTYLLKTYVGIESDKNNTIKNLNVRANEICRSGYDLIDEELYQEANTMGMRLPVAWWLSWQIKCNNQSES